MAVHGMVNATKQKNILMKRRSTQFYGMSFLICLLFCTSSFAQSTQDEKKVNQQIDTFFKGLNAKDTLLIKSTLGSSVNLKSILIKDDEKQLVSDNINEFLVQIGRLPKDLIIHEEIKNTEVHVRFPLAKVFTDYVFYVNNEKSHSGINLFTLAYLEDKWQIIDIVDTRE